MVSPLTGPADLESQQKGRPLRDALFLYIGLLACTRWRKKIHFKIWMNCCGFMNGVEPGTKPEKLFGVRRLDAAFPFRS